MQSVNKTARIIHFDGKSYLIGGTWTAGGRYPKNPNPKKAAKDEMFDPQHTSTVWLKESEQVGWFVFDGKAQNGRALAPLVLSKLQLNRVPWRGVFRLDGGWWVVAVDDSMALHPLWDVWVPEDQFQRFYEENSSKWMTFSHGLQLDTPEESWEWLLDEEDYRNAPKVTPVIATEQKLKKGAVTLVVLSAITGLGFIGDHFWKVHEQDVAQHQRMLQLAQEKLNAEASQKEMAMTQAEIQSEQKQIEHSWQDWPRPWMRPISWNTFFRTCDTAWSGKISDHGWMLTQVQCHWSAKKPSALVIHKTWLRGTFATVLHAPHGSVQKEGNIINQTQHVKWAWKKYANNGTSIVLSSILADKRFWLGNSQKWNDVIHITSGNVDTFLAPIPKGTPPKVAKALHPPILWRSFPVTFSSLYAPNRWPFWGVAGMVPSQLTAVLGKKAYYTVTGVQYAK